MFNNIANQPESEEEKEEKREERKGGRRRERKEDREGQRKREGRGEKSHFAPLLGFCKISTLLVKSIKSFGYFSFKNNIYYF